MAINPVNLAQINKLTLSDSTNKSLNIEDDFASYLSNAISNVGKLENEAKIATEKFVAGDIEIHDAMIAVERSEIALQFTMAVRNKIIDAYNEIMRMQI